MCSVRWPWRTAVSTHRSRPVRPGATAPTAARRRTGGASGPTSAPPDCSPRRPTWLGLPSRSAGRHWVWNRQCSHPNWPGRCCGRLRAHSTDSAAWSTTAARMSSTGTRANARGSGRWCSAGSAPVTGSWSSPTATPATVSSSTWPRPSPNDVRGNDRQGAPPMTDVLDEPTLVRTGRPGPATRSIISIDDLTDRDLFDLVARGVEFGAGAASRALAGAVTGVYFAKPSTRTRTAFSAGALRLGSGLIAYGPGDLQLTTGETDEDTGRVLAGMLDTLVMRTAGDESVMRSYAEPGGMSVVNAMSAQEHPTQALCDLSTLQEHF